MHVCLAFALLLLCWQTLASAGRSPIWPQPSNIHLGEQVLWVDRAMTATFYCGGKNAEALFSVPSPGTIPHYYDLLKQTVVSGSTMLRKRLPARTESSEDPQSKGQIPEQDILRQAVRQTLADIHSSSFVPWSFHKRHSKFEPEANSTHARLASLTIKHKICPVRLVDPMTFHGGREAYSLTLRDGSALIESSSSVGTLRALGQSRHYQVWMMCGSVHNR